MGTPTRLGNDLLLPLANIGLALGASLVYAAARDYRHAAYWFFVACIAVSVTV
jgi:hypothetical protein